MNRISTSSTYLAVLANLNDAQARQIRAGIEVSTQKNGSDLKGFARNAETLTAMNSIQTRVMGFLEQNRVLDDRFNTQDVALNRIADAAKAARQAITEALASGRGDTLMQELRSHFGDIVAGLNSKSQGKYLFAGGQLNTPPVDTIGMSDLTTGTVASRFHNDDFVTTSKLDETTSLQGSFLADDIGTPALEAFKAIQTFEQGLSGPISGAITEDQRAFLESQLGVLDDIGEDLTNLAARNGSFQRRIAAARTDLQGRADAMEAMIGDITDVDLPAAISRLEMSKVAIQASAQVFGSLRDSSLINYLRF